MGLGNSSSTRTTIVSIVNGRFTVRLQDGDENPDAIERKLKKGPNEGKTVTTRGVSGLLKYWLGEGGFEPLIERLRTSGEAAGDEQQKGGSDG